MYKIQKYLKSQKLFFQIKIMMNYKYLFGIYEFDI